MTERLDKPLSINSALNQTGSEHTNTLPSILGESVSENPFGNLSIPSILAPTPNRPFETEIPSWYRVEDRLTTRTDLKTLRDPKFVILHTTEIPSDLSLRTIVANASSHYVIDTDGKVYRTVPEDKVSEHAGPSLWDGLSGLNFHSIGIEIVGHTTKGFRAPKDKNNPALNPAQLDSLTVLLGQIQERHGISDRNVLTHSMVRIRGKDGVKPQTSDTVQASTTETSSAATGSLPPVPPAPPAKPERFGRYDAVQFGDLELRYRVGLESSPPGDPDVRRGRAEVLTGMNRRLQRVLYAGGRSVEATYMGQVDILFDARRLAGEKEYNTDRALYRLPDGRRRLGTEITSFELELPEGTEVYLLSVKTPETPSRRRNRRR